MSIQSNHTAKSSPSYETILLSPQLTGALMLSEAVWAPVPQKQNPMFKWGTSEGIPSQGPATMNTHQAGGAPLCTPAQQSHVCRGGWDVDSGCADS